MRFLRALVSMAAFAFVALFAYVVALRIRSGDATAALPPFAGKPSAFALRALAIAATVVTAGCVWRLSRTHGGTRFWAWASVGVFFAGFALTGFASDLDAPTALCVALIAMAAVVTSESKAPLAAMLGGLLLGAACLLRQPAVLFVAAAFCTLLKQPARAFALLGAAAAVIVPVALWQRAWFDGYVHGVSFSLHDLRAGGRAVTHGFALGIATFGVLPTLWRKPSLFAGLLLASFLGIFAGHTPLYWIPFGCVALALLASRIEVLLVGNLLAARAGELLCAIVLSQFALLAYDPRTHAVTAVPVARGDCTGGTLLPGFTNAHVHLTEPKFQGAAQLPADRLTAQLSDMFLRYGFTTVFDTGSELANTLAIRDRIAHGEVKGPRIFTTGPGLVPKDATPYYIRPVKLPEASTPEECRTRVQNALAGGADAIKIFSGSWVDRGKVVPMPVDIVRAITDEAHRAHKVVFAHPSNDAGFAAALDGGVDILAHTVEETRGFDDAIVARMKQAHMVLIPTLTLFGQNPNIDVILDEVHRYARAGGEILFGTDVGFRPDYDPTPEYELMARAGLSADEIIASLTPTRFGKTDGEVCLDGDPHTDIRALSRVRWTKRAGQLVYERR